jgi:hypothetical protein
MRALQSSLLLLLLSSAAGCIGVRFKPGFSMTDPAYFAEPPHIVARPDGYSLRWCYGTWGFFFQPSSKIVDGQLLYVLQSTSSSGHLSGRYGEMPITDARRVRALETGGAFWLEPDGRRVRLEIRR